MHVRKDMNLKEPQKKKADREQDMLIMETCEENMNTSSRWASSLRRWES